MAHTNETPHYKLPQFLAADKASWLGDINPAFLNIDTALFELAANASDALSSASAAQQSAQASQTAAEQAQAAVETVTEEVSTLKTQVQSQQTQLGTLSAGQTANSAEIASIKSNITTINADLSSNSQLITAAQQTATSAQQTANTAQEQAGQALTAASSAQKNITRIYQYVLSLTIPNTTGGALLFIPEVGDNANSFSVSGVKLILQDEYIPSISQLQFTFNLRSSPFAATVYNTLINSSALSTPSVYLYNSNSPVNIKITTPGVSLKTSALTITLNLEGNPTLPSSRGRLQGVVNF